MPAATHSLPAIQLMHKRRHDKTLAPLSPPVDRKARVLHRFVFAAKAVRHWLFAGGWRLTLPNLLFMGPPRSGHSSGAISVVPR
jgi:hypothetical protein